MASASVPIALLPLNKHRHQHSGNLRSHLHAVSPLRRVRASVSVSTEIGVEGQNDVSAKHELFACPICYEPLIRIGPSGLNLNAIYRSGFKCQKCQKDFSSKDVYLDLTVTSGTTAYSEVKPIRSELFRNPIVSFVYERGWRQAFKRSGFPGRDKEFKMAQDYFEPVSGGFLLDVSCGSGLFSRKFASSGMYSGVIALDFSENMLRQCYEFIGKDDSLLNSNLALVRADISRLPFSSGSVDAVHAGAALHCWPSPSNAVAEISRVLKSGGVFVGTTFLSTRLNTPLSSRSLGHSVRYLLRPQTLIASLLRKKLKIYAKPVALSTTRAK